MQNEGSRKGSIWAGHISNDNVFAGHSMGGGAAFLAAKQATSMKNLNLTSVIALAPAETNPSSSSAATSVVCPTLILAGTIDCVTPLAGTVQPIYNNLASKCKVLAVIPGASHCQFADANTTCNLGELNCQATISRAVQLSRCWNYINAMLRRSDDVAKVVDDTQVQTTYSRIDRTKLQVSRAEACIGDTVTLTYPGGTNELLWLPDSTRGPSYRIRVGTGEVKVSLVSTSCFSSFSIDTTIIGLVAPTISIQGVGAICPGDSSILSATTNGTAKNPVSLRWSTGETSPTLIVKTPGIYSATATSVRGCGMVTASHDLTVEPVPSISVKLIGDTVFCAGTGTLEARLVGGVDLVQDISWNTGDTSRVISINVLGTQRLFARMRLRNGMQCTLESDTVEFTTRRIDATMPVVSMLSDTLWSSVADSYQWMFNDIPLQGATKQYCVPTKSGAYAVTTMRKEEFGCRATSKSLQVTLTMVNSDPCISRISLVQNGQTLRVQSVIGPSNINVIDYNGRIVFDSNYDGSVDNYEVDLSALPPSVYAVQLRDHASATTIAVLLAP